MKTIKGSKSQKSKSASLPSPHDDRKVMIIAGACWNSGTPVAEAGPSSWAHTYAQRATVWWVAQEAIEQMASRPTNRSLFSSSKPSQVIVIADQSITVEQRDWASARAASCVGTYSEAARLGKSLLWIPVPIYETKDAIARLALNELHAILAADSSLEPEDVLIVLWKSNAGSFGGDSVEDIAATLRDVVFTTGCEGVPALLD